MRAQQGIKTMQGSIALNVLLVIIKIVSGIFGHSYALVADGIESLGDVLSSSIVLIGLFTAAKEPDDLHPYGHGKAEPIAAVIVSIMLMVAAAGIIYSSYLHIITPHEIPHVFTLYVLAGVIVAKQLMFRYVKHQADSIHSQSVKADAWHHLSDAISSFAALIGVGIAIYFGAGYESADDWAALFAAGFILLNALQFLRNGIRELMDANPGPEFILKVETLANEVAGAKSAHKVRIRKMGLEYFIDIHVQVDGELSVRHGHEIAHDVKEHIRKNLSYVIDVLVHIEPTGE
jgi:cation diffusion facilitator family transporter